MGSPQLLIIELIILVVFSADFILRVIVAKKTIKEILFLLIDLIAIIPSAIIVWQYVSGVSGADIEFLALLRLFRLARILKLLRMQNAVVSIFGASVLTLVFGVMTFHLGLRVVLLEAVNISGIDVDAVFDRTVLSCFPVPTLSKQNGRRRDIPAPPAQSDQA